MIAAETKIRSIDKRSFAITGGVGEAIRFDARDGAALSGGRTVTITALADSEIVLVDAA